MLTHTYLNHFPQLVQMSPDIYINLIEFSKNVALDKVQFLNPKNLFSFNISGEVTGTFTCSTISFNDLQKAAFVEGMNILIGNTISSIEEKTGMTLNLESPQKGNSLKEDDLVHRINYNFHFYDKVFPCSIYYRFENQSHLSNLSSSEKYQEV